MKQLRIALALMTTFTLLIGGVVYLISADLARAFSANSALNALIIAILVFGTSVSFVQVIQLAASIKWVCKFRESKENSSPAPRMIAPIASALANGGIEHLSLSSASTRSLLDSVYVRLDEGREVTRYLMNTLILLGLMGTFWGLLQTVGGITTVVGGLNVGDGDLKLVFEKFKEGLQTPLKGMGISFSASLFGLASSLILGFFDLTTGRVQTRFCEELEDWLTSGAPLVNGEAHSRATTTATPSKYQHALVENLGDQFERLQKVFRQQEDSREADRSSIRKLAEGLSALDDHLRAQQSVMVKLAELQQQVAPVLNQLHERMSNNNQQTIEEHTRRIDINLREIGERVSRSADVVASEVREELKIIAKILAADETRNNASA